MTETALDYESRLSRLEGITEQINHRLDQMQQQINQMQQQMNQMQQQMNQMQQQMQQQMNQIQQQMQQQMNQQFRWIVGIQLTSLIALGTLILSKLSG